MFRVTVYGSDISGMYRGNACTGDLALVHRGMLEAQEFRNQASQRSRQARELLTHASKEIGNADRFYAYRPISIISFCISEGVDYRFTACTLVDMRSVRDLMSMQRYGAFRMHCSVAGLVWLVNVLGPWPCFLCWWFCARDAALFGL